MQMQDSSPMCLSQKKWIYWVLIRKVLLLLQEDQPEKHKAKLWCWHRLKYAEQPGTGRPAQQPFKELTGDRPQLVQVLLPVFCPGEPGEGELTAVDDFLVSDQTICTSHSVLWESKQAHLRGKVIHTAKQEPPDQDGQSSKSDED